MNWLRTSMLCLWIMASLPGTVRAQALAGQIDNLFYISTRLGNPLPPGEFVVGPSVDTVSFDLVSVLDGPPPTSIVWSLGTSAIQYQPVRDEFSLPGTQFTFGHDLGRGRAPLALTRLGDEPGYGTTYRASFHIGDTIIQPGTFLAIGGASVSLYGAIAYTSQPDQTTLSFNGSSLYFSAIQASPVQFTFSSVSAVPEPASMALMLAGGLVVAGVARRGRGARAVPPHPVAG